MPTIKKIKTSPEGFRPILVNFENGEIKPKDNIHSSLYKNVDGKTIVGVTNNNMLYTGEIDNQSNFYNNVLLVHNKDTGKIRLIQVDCCNVSPFVENKGNLMDVTITTFASSESELSKQFGSKKSKRSIEQKERLQMNVGTVKNQLENTVTDMKVSETDETFTNVSENDNLYRPKINRNASTVDQVYRIEDTVPQNVLDSLCKEAGLIVEGADLNAYDLITFCSTSISEVLNSTVSDELKIHRISVFLYINYLMKFMNTPMKNITKKFVACDKSAEVNLHILGTYSITSGNHRMRPLTMKDKALCTILVLAALAGNYQVNIEKLSKDFKMGIKKVLEISRVLAFSVSSKDKSYITLKLPLPPPVASSNKRKRK